MSPTRHPPPISGGLTDESAVGRGGISACFLPGGPEGSLKQDEPPTPCRGRGRSTRHPSRQSSSEIFRICARTVRRASLRCGQTCGIPPKFPDAVAASIVEPSSLRVGRLAVFKAALLSGPHPSVESAGRVKAGGARKVRITGAGCPAGHPDSFFAKLRAQKRPTPDVPAFRAVLIAFREGVRGRRFW